MKIGPKYKLARRLGAAVFEKTQSPKFAASEEKRKNIRRGRRPAAKTNYGLQLLEKQKVRFTYALSEKQFSKYVKQVIEKKSTTPADDLFNALERRLDNVILRSGFAASRLMARQTVSHGHITVNGTRVTIPSIQVNEGDVIGIREGSKEKNLFAELDSRLAETNIPKWLKVDSSKRTITVTGQPTYVPGDSHFNLLTVVQFYKR